jgi:hypothetical protein
VKRVDGTHFKRARVDGTHIHPAAPHMPSAPCLMRKVAALQQTTKDMLASACWQVSPLHNPHPPRSRRGKGSRRQGGERREGAKGRRKQPAAPWSCYRHKQGRMKRKGTRKGMIVKEHPHVQKLRTMAMKMMIRIVIEKIQHPPRRRRTK